ncbi:MAG: 4'-phosphopantetheinyl transferase superfamily protein [Planctomycetota bacterium]
MIEVDCLPFVGELFDEPVLATVASLTCGPTDLRPTESRHVAKACSRRIAEFATGRASARHLLRQLGYGEPDIEVDPLRCPMWPKGVVGSIAHCEDLCIVALGPNLSVQGLGVDVEPNAPLEQKLWPIICTKNEQAWLDRQPSWNRGNLARLLFCAKEATYKCWFPETRRVLEFIEIEIELDCKGDRFRAEVIRTGSPGCESERSFSGRWLIRNRWMFTGVARRKSAISMVA